MRVHLASRGAADFLGEDLTIAVAADAHVFKAVGARFQGITLGDLVVGEKLRTEGVIDYSSGTASFVGKRLVMRRLPLNDIKRFAFRGRVTAVDATAGTLTATMDRVTRALSPYYHATCDFVVAPDARIWVMKDGWPVKASARGRGRRRPRLRAGRRRPQHAVGAGVHHPLDGRAARAGGVDDPLTEPADESRGRAALRAARPSLIPRPCACSSASARSSCSRSSTLARRRDAPGSICSRRPGSVFLLAMTTAASLAASASPSSSASLFGRLSSA